MEWSQGTSSQIIDLTGDDDDEPLPSIEHDVAPVRAGRSSYRSVYGRQRAAASALGNSAPQPPSQLPSQLPSRIPSQVPSRPSPRFFHHPYSSPYFTSATAAAVQTRPPFQSAQPSSSSTGIKLLDLDFIVKPINPAAVLQRSAYDPTTIARDVLLAADIHPHRPGLNARARLLIRHFLHVNESSDLATFRWDLVDPGGPSPQSTTMPPMYGIAGMPMPSTSGTNSNLNHANILGSQLPPSSLPARPLDPLPNHSNLLQNPTLRSPGSSLQVVVPTISPARAAEYPRVESPEPDELSSSYVAPSASKFNLSNLASPSVGTKTPVTAIKKRGRLFSKTPLSGTSTPTAKPRETTIKKRGRPFRNGIGPAEPKKKGPGRVSQPKVETSDPKFIPFLCEWKNCPAELHNLETLRLHLFTVHGKPRKDGSIPCLWGPCHPDYDEGDTPNSSNSAKRFEFDSKEKWQSHISKAHLIPIAWYLGDGPKGTSMDIIDTTLSPQSQPWLYDSFGRQVTPSVAKQPTEGGRARDNNARRFAEQQKGVYVILEPVKNPEEYVRVVADSEDEVDELL